MEIKRSGIKMTQQIAWSTSDGHVLGHVRSYRCSFCKRGFSNAQALGGHMNIHRKDRARLKGSSDETSFSMDQDFTKKNQSSPPTAFSNDDLLQLDTSHDHDVHEKSCAHKRPWIFSEEDEESPRRKYCYKQVVQLPFFVEKSYTSNDFGTSSFGDGCVGKKHGSSSLELDLELRLGPEPQDSPCINKR